jgi:hypothetical protein
MLSKKELIARANDYAKEMNYEEMVKCLQTLITEYNDSGARYSLAKYYIAYQINPNESRELLEKAMERKHFDATFELYKLTKDISYLEKGSGFGSGKCSNELALYYLDSQKDVANAEKFFKLAIKQKDMNAVSNYAKLLEKTDCSKAVELYKECLKEKHTTGIWGFARLIYDDIHNIIDLSFMDDLLKEYEEKEAEEKKKMVENNGELNEVCEHVENMANEATHQDAVSEATHLDVETLAMCKAVDEQFDLREKRVKCHEILLCIASDKRNIYATADLIAYYNSILHVKGTYTKLIQRFQLFNILYTQNGYKFGDDTLTNIYRQGIQVLAQHHRIMFEKDKEHEMLHQMCMVQNYRECINYCCGADMEIYAQIITEDALAYHVERADNGSVNDAFFVALYYNIHQNSELMEKYASIASTKIDDALMLLCIHYRNTNNVKKLLEFGMTGIDRKMHFIADLLAKYWKTRGNDKLAIKYEEMASQWKPSSSDIRENLVEVESAETPKVEEITA